MRNLAYILFLCASAAFGQPGGNFNIGGNASVGGNEYGVYSAPCPDITSQDFESGSLPPGWATDQGTPNYNFSPALLGSFSLRCVSGASSYYQLATTNTDNFAFFYYEATSIATNVICTFYNNDGSFPADVAFQMALNSSGALTVWCKGGGSQATTVSTMSANTLYYVWVHFKFVTATTCVASVAFSATEVEPTNGNNFASLSNGTAAHGATVFEAGGVGSITQIFDHIGWASSDCMSTGWGGH